MVSPQPSTTLGFVADQDEAAAVVDGAGENAKHMHWESFYASADLTFDAMARRYTLAPLQEQQLSIEHGGDKANHEAGR